MEGDELILGLIKKEEHKNSKNIYVYKIESYLDTPTFINITNKFEKKEFHDFLIKNGISFQKSCNTSTIIPLPESDFTLRPRKIVSDFKSKFYRPVVTKNKQFTKEDLHEFLRKRFSSYK